MLLMKFKHIRISKLKSLIQSQVQFLKLLCFFMLCLILAITLADIILQHNITHYHATHSITPPPQPFLFFTLTISNLKQPYQYPVLQVCTDPQCSTTSSDLPAYSQGQKYQFVKLIDPGNQVWYRVVSLNNATNVGEQVYSVKVESDSSNTCSPLCMQHGNDCRNGKCICKLVTSAGTHCSTTLQEAQLSKRIELELPNTGYLSVHNLYLFPQNSDELQQIKINMDFEGLIVYTKKSNNVLKTLPGNKFENDGAYIVNGNQSLPFQDEDGMSLIITFEKTNLHSRGKIVVVLQQDDEDGWNWWVIVIIVVSVILGLICLGCVIYYCLYKQNNLDIHPQNSQNLQNTQIIQSNLFDQYFPEISYSELCALLHNQHNQSIQQITINQECAICIDEFKRKDLVRVLYCHHYFHSLCLKEWYKKNKNCPFCRSDNSWIQVRGLVENGYQGYELIQAIQKKHHQRMVKDKLNN